jgi:hypothetical protein
MAHPEKEIPMYDPPGISAFLTRVANMDCAELTAYRNEVRERYEAACRQPCDNLFAETGAKLIGRTALDRINAISVFCDYFWLTNTEPMRVADCLARVAALANGPASRVQ